MLIGRLRSGQLNIQRTDINGEKSEEGTGKSETVTSQGTVKCIIRNIRFIFDIRCMQERLG